MIRIGWRPSRNRLAPGHKLPACLVPPGVAYYVYLATVLPWIELTALRLS